MIELSTLGLDKLSAKTHNGKIYVTAADSDSGTIEIQAHIRGYDASRQEAQRAVDAVEIVTLVDGATQSLSWRWRDQRQRSNVSVSFEITLPGRMALAAETQNGELLVEGVRGRCDLKTENGRVEVQGADGGLLAHSRNGALEIETPASTVDLESQNGSVEAELLADGPVEGSIKTQNGGIRLRIGPLVDCQIHGKTLNGALRCELPESGAAERKLLPGPKELDATSGPGTGQLNVESQNGSIRIAPAELPADAIR